MYFEILLIIIIILNKYYGNTKRYVNSLAKA